MGEMARGARWREGEKGERAREGRDREWAGGREGGMEGGREGGRARGRDVEMVRGARERK